MENLLKPVFLMLFAALLFTLSSCGPTGGEDAEKGKREKETEKKELEEEEVSEPELRTERDVYLLPRSLEGFTLGDSFTKPEDFEEPEDAPVVMFNEKEGKTFATRGYYGRPEKGVTSILVNTIEGMILSIERKVLLDREAAVKEVGDFKEKYKEHLEAGSNFESEGRDFEWYRFGDEKTVCRIERDREIVTLTITAFDLF